MKQEREEITPMMMWILGGIFLCLGSLAIGEYNDHATLSGLLSTTSDLRSQIKLVLTNQDSHYQTLTSMADSTNQIIQ